MICGQTCDGIYHFALYLVKFGVHFGESLIVRLYSEIDHIHLSSEAQCVSHLYPQVDCHRPYGCEIRVISHLWHKIPHIPQDILKGTSRGLEALQSHTNNSYSKSLLCWQYGQP